MEIGATGSTATLQNTQANESRQQVRRDNQQQQAAELETSAREAAPAPSNNERVGTVVNTQA